MKLLSFVLEGFGSRPKTVLAIAFTIAITGELILLQNAGYLFNERLFGGDAPEYHQLAINVLDHGVFTAKNSQPLRPSIVRTPGYPLFLALIYLVSGRSLVAVRVVQLALVAVISWVVSLISTRFMPQWWACLTGLLCITYPPLVCYSIFHHTEIFATSLLVVFLFLLVRFAESRSRAGRRALLIGIVLGAAILVRPTCALLVFPAVAVIWWTAALAIRERARAVAALCLGTALLVFPWIIRNYDVSQHFVPFGTLGGDALFLAARQYSGDLSYKFTISEFQAANADYKRRELVAKQQVRANPVGDGYETQRIELMVDKSYKDDVKGELSKVKFRQLPANLATRLAYLWSTADPLPPGHESFHRAVQLQWLLIILLTAAGAALNWRSLLIQWPLWCLAVYFTLIHVVYYSDPRYSIPARPLLMAYVISALMYGNSAIRKKLGHDAKAYTASNM